MPAIPDEVPASERLMQELTIATDASIGVIAIRCPETEVYRLCDDLYSLAQAMDTQFFLHTAETGWGTYDKIDKDDIHAEPFDPLAPKTEDKGTADVQKAFQALYDTGGLPGNGIFVMLDLFYTFSEQRTQTAIRKQMQRSLSCDQRLFLIVPHTAEIPDAIAPLMHVIDFDYPTREELSQSLDAVLESLEEDDRPEITEEERQAIIANGQGMTAHSFETAVALSITEYGARRYQNGDADTEADDAQALEGYSAEDIMNMIRSYKMQLLRKTNVLELQPSVEEDDIGGLDLFKEWMHQRKSTYDDDAKEAGITPSRGAMVIGPPGTGKSLVAKAAGSILNLPVIRFDVGRVFNAYIGSSEQTMRGVLKMLDAMAPCVLMLDEVDKGFAGMMGGGTNDSGTTQRVFGTFLTWMQERDQQNRPMFLIMTANRIQGLPPELLRKGRIDEIWAVTMPNEDERREIIKIHAAKRGQEVPDADMPGMVRLSDNLVGSEIEAVIEDALVLSLSAGEAGLSYEYFEKARAYIKPMAKTREEEFKAMQVWADSNARAASSPMDAYDTNDKPRGARTRVVRKAGVRKAKARR